MPPRKLPRPFEMHWGRGQIVEEASYTGEYHEPCVQLMEYTEGGAAGSYSIRFCTYSLRGAFLRSPLMLTDADIEGLRKAIATTPRLHALLKRLTD